MLNSYIWTLQVFKLTHPPSHHWNPQSQHPATRKVQLLSTSLHGKWATTTFWRTVIWSKKGLRYSGLYVPFLFPKRTGIRQTKLKNQSSSWKLLGNKHAHPTYKDTMFGQWCLATAKWHPGKMGVKNDGSSMLLKSVSQAALCSNNMLIAGTLWSHNMFWNKLSQFWGVVHWDVGSDEWMNLNEIKNSPNQKLVYFILNRTRAHTICSPDSNDLSLQSSHLAIGAIGVRTWGYDLEKSHYTETQHLSTLFPYHHFVCKTFGQQDFPLV